MSDAFVMARPKDRVDGAAYDDFVVEDVDCKILHVALSQNAAVDWAKANGFRPLIQKSRSFRDKADPDNWTEAP